MARVMVKWSKEDDKGDMMVRLYKNTSDGKPTLWDVEIGNVVIPCPTQRDAEERFSFLKDLCNNCHAYYKSEEE